MMRAGLFAFIGAFALIAGCANEADEVQGEEAVTSEASGAAATADPDAELAGAAEGALACVKDVPADAICTMDLNQCGHSGSCNCGPGYIYNASMGKCLLIMDGVGEATRPDVADDDCVKAATGICTKDINVCGQPSSCQCEDGFAWNATAGKCVKA
jgi:hypothetical protein